MVNMIRRVLVVALFSVLITACVQKQYTPVPKDVQYERYQEEFLQVDPLQVADVEKAYADYSAKPGHKAFSACPFEPEWYDMSTGKDTVAAAQRDVLTYVDMVLFDVDGKMVWNESLQAYVDTPEYAAFAAYALGDFTVAASRFGELHKMQPADNYIANRYGWSLYFARQYEKAGEVFGELRKNRNRLWTGNTEGYAKSMWRQGRVKDALAALDAGIAITASGSLQMAKAFIELDQGDPTGVKELLGDRAFVGFSFFTAFDGIVIREEPPKNSPASHAGLQAGDTVLSFDATPLKGLSSSEVIRIIQSKKSGERIKLKVMRNGSVKNMTLHLL